MAKGGAYENEICKTISLMWSRGERSDLCRRSEGSGARFTSRRKKGEEGTIYQAGDITFSNDIIKPFFDYYSLELKSGYNKKKKTETGNIVTTWDTLEILDSNQKEPLFIKFWKQCSNDAFDSGRRPMLIFRRNQRKSCIALSSYEFHNMLDFFGDFGRPQFIIYTDEIKNIIIVNFNDWKSWIGEGLEGYVTYELNRRK